MTYLTCSANKTITLTYSVPSSVAPDPSVSNPATAATNGNTFPTPPPAALARNVTLTVAKAFQDTSVDAGTGSHTFTITVHNSGPSDAASTHITDTVDTRLNVTNVSESGAGQVRAASRGQSIDCTLASPTNG